VAHQGHLALLGEMWEREQFLLFLVPTDPGAISGRSYVALYHKDALGYGYTQSPISTGQH
jgi:hypothetical protein